MGLLKMLTNKSEKICITALLASSFMGCDTPNNSDADSSQIEARVSEQLELNDADVISLGNSNNEKLDQTKSDKETLVNKNDLISSDKNLTFNYESFKVGDRVFEISLTSEYLTGSPPNLTASEHIDAYASRVLHILQNAGFLSSVSYAQGDGANVIVKLDQGRDSEEVFKIDFKDVPLNDVSVVLLNQVCEKLINKGDILIENIDLDMVEKQRKNTMLTKKINLMEHLLYPGRRAPEDVKLASEISGQMNEVYYELNQDHKFLASFIMQNVINHAANARLGSDYLDMNREKISEEVVKTDGKNISIELSPVLDNLIVSFDTLMQNKPEPEEVIPPKPVAAKR